MNWWIFVQISQWVVNLTSASEYYRLSDEAFFAQPSANQIMALDKVDTLLLDATIFQATNEARRKAGLASLQYDPGLYRAARNHAGSMIRHDFVSHDDLYQLGELTLLKRVQNHTHRFSRMAENIGQYQTIETAEWYGVRFNARRQRYEYIDPANKQLYAPYTYAGYARYAVQQWLDSPHHRANLLNPVFTHIGCACRLSLQPYQQRRAPFGRLVQDFGGQHPSTQASR